MAVVWDGEEETVSLYLDGELVMENQSHFALSDLEDVNNWLGRAQWNDPMYVGDYRRVPDLRLSPCRPTRFSETSRRVPAW